MLNELTRWILPARLQAIRSLYRSHREALAIHEQMKAIGQEIDIPLQQGVEVLPNRLALLDRLPKKGVVAEIGVAEGHFSSEILTRCSPVRLHLVDMWRSSLAAGSEAALAQLKARLRDELAQGVVQLHRGMSWDMIGQFPIASLDWIYIDAGHDYESVKRDLNAALPRIKAGGYICGHDYILWSGNGLSRFGVVEAVNEFMNVHRWRMVFITNQLNRHLSFALQAADCDVPLPVESGQDGRPRD